jgi:hypothetical protein
MQQHKNVNVFLRINEKMALGLAEEKGIPIQEGGFCCEQVFTVWGSKNGKRLSLETLRDDLVKAGHHPAGAVITYCKKSGKRTHYFYKLRFQKESAAIAAADLPEQITGRCYRTMKAVGAGNDLVLVFTHADEQVASELLDVRFTPRGQNLITLESRA